MYDVVIIGAGMSGLAAGIRLAMFGQRVCILERHYAVGGLNSYYRLDGRNYDVGLHALTNFAPRGAKQGPLPRLLRQLRMSWDELELAEQQESAVEFPGVRLRFSNDPELWVSEIEHAFPHEADHYRQFLTTLLGYDQLHLKSAQRSAREVLASNFGEPLLSEMLLCPVLFYGGPQEHDLDWGSFSVLYRSIFLEGLARPAGGIRVILRNLTKRFKQLGGELRLRTGVREIAGQAGRLAGVVLDDGTPLATRQVISSAGWNETLRLCESSTKMSMDASSNFKQDQTTSGQMTFFESICTLDCQPHELEFDQTIVFSCDSGRFNYACPSDLVDLQSGIVCSPNNYRYESVYHEGPLEGTGSPKVHPAEGTLRLTALANFDKWAALGPEEYQAEKHAWHKRMISRAERYVPGLSKHLVASDTFTPKTIRHFTGHDRGAVYGAPQKRYDAKTPLENLLICGADQGFVGIVGTLTSGIQVANLLLRENS